MFFGTSHNEFLAVRVTSALTSPVPCPRHCACMLGLSCPRNAVGMAHDWPRSVPCGWLSGLLLLDQPEVAELNEIAVALQAQHVRRALLLAARSARGAGNFDVVVDEDAVQSGRQANA